MITLITINEIVAGVGICMIDNPKVNPTNNRKNAVITTHACLLDIFSFNIYFNPYQPFSLATLCK